MKIVIATPLYPPDIAEPAPYVKTLAGMLAPYHSVTVALYGKLPEEVPGVQYVCIDKQALLPLRLLRYTVALIQQAKHADILYIENGASVELPAIILSLLFLRMPIIFHIGDVSAHKHANNRGLRKYIERLVRKRAYETIEAMPPSRPEILPLAPYPQQAFAQYNTSWQKHIKLLTTIFDHARK